MTTLLFATSNSHKADELRQMLGSQWDVKTLRDHPELISPEETGSTFEANAAIKAVAASLALRNIPVLSDDSGLEVDALAGEPGVHSARYAGPAATDADNRQKLKTELTRLLDSGQSAPFTARFRCCLVLTFNGEIKTTHHGTVEGQVLPIESGEGGFGYDPLFIPEGHQETFGTLPASTKNALSHRARALQSLAQWLQDNPDWQS